MSRDNPITSLAAGGGRGVTTCFIYCRQEAQLSQTARATFCVVENSATFQRQIKACSLNLGYGSIKVTEYGAIR